MAARKRKTKTSLAKAKTLLPSENVALNGEKTLLPSETVTRKCENALTEPKTFLLSLCLYGNILHNLNLLTFQQDIRSDLVLYNLYAHTLRVQYISFC